MAKTVTKTVTRKSTAANGSSRYVVRDSKSGKFTEVKTRPKSSKIVQEITSERKEMLQRLAKR